MSGPVLHLFAISHYCEKARWALDHYGIGYQARFVSPGLHMLTAKRVGVRRSSVPILVLDGQAIQGSSRIIDWADGAATADANSLTPSPVSQACRDVEKRLDDIAGVHVRRYYYSEALIEHPATVRPIFMRDLGMAQRVLLRASWGSVRSLMIKGMDLGPRQGLDSRSIVEAELDWLDAKLSDGRAYLVGESFTRADIAAASLLAPLALPKEHPAYSDFVLPPGIAADVNAWRDRPSLLWVKRTYARHRR